LIQKLDHLSLGGNPVYYRTGTDDLELICSILVRQEYGCVGEDVGNAKLIVDCGAYAGYSTLYFLTKYENAHVIALEPDERNFELCRLNLEAYAGRVTLLKAAIWPKKTQLALRENELAGVRREWASVVGPPRGNETAQTQGIDFATLLQESGFTEIDLVKLNVNGIEELLFSENADAWLPHVKNIVIRPLNEELEKRLLESLEHYQFLLTRGTGLFAFTRLREEFAAPSVSELTTMSADAIANGGFEDLRVGPGRIVPGRWICEPHDVTRGWQIAVCDPQFRVSLAVRTGAQRNGHTALRVSLNTDVPVLPHSAPYAAIETTDAIKVSEGHDWLIGAFVKTRDDGLRAKGLRGAYLFMRLWYEDGSFADLRTQPVFDVTDEYVPVGGLVSIPISEQRRLERATLWLYAWIENHEPIAVSTCDYSGWQVYFDDVSYSQGAAL
jgi:FkbM family methyltransferase